MMEEHRALALLPSRDGEELEDQSVMVTDREIDFTTSRMNERRLRVWSNGRRKDVKLSLRMYSLHELVKMCRSAGMEYQQAFGDSDSSGYDFKSKRCIMIARKS